MSLETSYLTLRKPRVHFNLSPITKYKLYVTKETLAGMIDYMSEYCIYLKYDNDLLDTTVNTILVTEFMTSNDTANNVIKYIASIIRYNTMNIIKIYYPDNDTRILTTSDFPISDSITTYGEIHKDIDYKIKNDIYNKLNYTSGFIIPTKYDNNGDVIMWNS